MGNTDFYGKGLQVDTSKKFTVVTQFKPGRLTQFFVQNGKKILAPAPTIEGISDTGDITAEFCTNQFKTFNDRDRFAEVGGFSQLDAALGVPMVLVMSIWDDVRAPLSPGVLVQHDANRIASTTPTCSGSTPPTPRRRRASPVLPVVLADRTPAFPQKLKVHTRTAR